MRKLLTIGFAAIFTTVIISCNNSNNKSADTSVAADELVSRGHYLVTIMGCNDCHTPKKMGPNGPELDSTRLLSGHPSHQPIGKIDPKELKDWVLFNHDNTAVAGPWGVSFSGNLTSDATGIGNWTEEQFFRALRQGKYKGLPGSRDLLPPMPWQLYRNIKDEDLRAIYYYLKSTPPVKNIVPAPIPPDSILGK
jgi:hypothetical protein